MKCDYCGKFMFRWTFQTFCLNPETHKMYDQFGCKECSIKRLEDAPKGKKE